MFLMDNIINELINDYELSDYEALVVTGIMGLIATGDNVKLQDIYKSIDNKLKPIVNTIINK